MKRLQPIILLFLCLILAPTAALAQADCPAIVQTVMANLESLCANAQRNDACYGNLAMDVVPQQGVTDFTFSQIGDIEGVNNIAALRLAPLDTNAEAWGVVLMRLQASLPDALPGQNVTFLLFGDTELINAVPEGSEDAPMSAFYLRTGIGEPACSEAPKNGLMVRTPEGVGEVNFSVNGVDVALGSTSFLAAIPGQDMTISTLEGSASMRTRDGRIVPILAGSGAKIPIGEDLLPTGDPLPPAPYDADVWDNFEQVIDNYFEDFDVREPLTQEELDQISSMWDEGLPPCGSAPFLPDCDNLIHSLGGDKCALDESGIDFSCAEDASFFWDDVSASDLPRFLSYSEVDDFFADTWDPSFWENWDGRTDFNEDGFGFDDLSEIQPFPFDFTFSGDYSMDDFFADMEGSFPDGFDYDAFVQDFESEYGDEFQAFLDQYDGELPDDFFDQINAEFGDDFNSIFEDFGDLPDDFDFGDIGAIGSRFGDFSLDRNPVEDLGILPPDGGDDYGDTSDYGDASDYGDTSDYGSDYGDTSDYGDDYGDTGDYGSDYGDPGASDYGDSGDDYGSDDYGDTGDYGSDYGDTSDYGSDYGDDYGN